MEVNQILETIMKDGTRMNTTVKRYAVNEWGAYCKTTFSNLVSEIAIDYLNRRQRIESIPDKEVVYYLAATCLNMVASSTSKYHKNVRKTLNTNKKQEPIWELIEGEDKGDEEIKRKVTLEKDLNNVYTILEWLYDNNHITWFDKEMFLEYHLEEKSYRQMGRRYDITIRHIWLSVTGVADKIKKIYYGGGEYN